MASRSSRERATRRDRRLAKASSFAREGKANCKRVGHGASGTVQNVNGRDGFPSKKGFALMRRKVRWGDVIGHGALTHQPFAVLRCANTGK